MIQILLHSEYFFQESESYLGLVVIKIYCFENLSIVHYFYHFKLQNSKNVFTKVRNSKQLDATQISAYKYSNIKSMISSHQSKT